MTTVDVAQVDKQKLTDAFKQLADDSKLHIVKFLVVHGTTGAPVGYVVQVRWRASMIRQWLFPVEEGEALDEVRFVHDFIQGKQ